MVDNAAWEFMQVLVDDSDGSWNAVGPADIKSGQLDENIKGTHLVASLLSAFGGEGWQLAGVLPAVAGSSSTFSLLLQRPIEQPKRRSMGFGS